MYRYESIEIKKNKTSREMGVKKKKRDLRRSREIEEMKNGRQLVALRAETQGKWQHQKIKVKVED
jgi:hypothetical protein